MFCICRPGLASQNPPVLMHPICNEISGGRDKECSFLHQELHSYENGKTEPRGFGGEICRVFLTVDFRLLHQCLGKATVSRAMAHLHAPSASDVPRAGS